MTSVPRYQCRQEERSLSATLGQSAAADVEVVSLPLHASAAGWSVQFGKRAKSFLEDPLPIAPLGFFRIAVGGFLILQALLWYPDWMAFFGPDGWLQWEISQALNVGWTLHLAQIHSVLRHLGLSDVQSTMAFFWLYVGSGVGLLFGFHTRFWAVLACLCHYVIMSTLSTFTYGVDVFLQMSLFYLAVMPVAKAWSIDVWQGRVGKDPTWASTLSIRVLQLHLCLVYISSGVEKLRSPGWWDGNVIWRSLVQPDFRQYEVVWLAHYPWLAISLSWFTMVIEAGYFVAMWVPRLRLIWLAGIIALHLGIGLMLGLWLFGLMMIILSISAFGYAAVADLKAIYATRTRRYAELPSRGSPSIIT